MYNTWINVRNNEKISLLISKYLFNGILVSIKKVSENEKKEFHAVIRCSLRRISSFGGIEIETELKLFIFTLII